MSTEITIGDFGSPGKARVSQLFKVDLRKIPRRLLSSFVPPSLKSNRFDVDLLGPILVVLLLSGILHYGASLRRNVVPLSPAEAILIYTIFIPLGTTLLLKASVTKLTYLQVMSLLGYALFSHVVTIIITVLMRTPRSHVVFFLVFTILGGLSSVRLVIIFTLATHRPAVKLLASCFACIAHLLFLLFFYFAYIPPF